MWNTLSYTLCQLPYGKRLGRLDDRSFDPLSGRLVDSPWTDKSLGKQNCERPRRFNRQNEPGFSRKVPR